MGGFNIPPTFLHIADPYSINAFRTTFPFATTRRTSFPYSSRNFERIFIPKGVQRLVFLIPK